MNVFQIVLESNQNYKIALIIILNLWWWLKNMLKMSKKETFRRVCVTTTDLIQKLIRKQDPQVLFFGRSKELGTNFKWVKSTSIQHWSLLSENREAVSFKLQYRPQNKWKNRQSLPELNAFQNDQEYNPIDLSWTVGRGTVRIETYDNYVKLRNFQFTEGVHSFKKLRKVLQFHRSKTVMHWFYCRMLTLQMQRLHWNNWRQTSLETRIW